MVSLIKWGVSGISAGMLAALALAPISTGAPGKGEDRWWEAAPIATNSHVDLPIQGDIVRGETARDFLRRGSGHIVDRLILSSDGGSLNEAIEIAYIVHNHQIKTEIPSGSDCASACAIIFLAGADRVLNGRLGVHQFSPTTGSVTPWEVQHVVAEILDLIDEFDAPIQVLRHMMGTPPEDMFWFDVRSKDLFSRPRSGLSGNDHLVAKPLP